jgi:DNA polymerase-4
MDAFYASVEQRDRPELRGQPVAVGGSPEARGVVAAASYEARKFGVRSAIPMSRAVRLCPQLVIVRPDFTKYRAVSQQVFAIFRAITPLVEPLSLDEAYLDVTENAWGETLGTAVAKRLKEEIRSATGLTASAGVAPNKFLAKIASGWKKPDGLTVIAPERVEAFLQGLPVDALWGVGPVTAGKLRERGITKLVDVRTAEKALLQEAVGSMAEWLQQLAHGIDDRAVVSEHEPKSSGSENTFAQDLTDLDRIRSEVAEMARDAAAWLARKALFARTVTLKVRYDDFTTITRSHTDGPSRDELAIVSRAVALLDRTEAGQRPVRLLGVSVHNLVETLDPPEPASPQQRLPFDLEPSSELEPTREPEPEHEQRRENREP